MRARRVSHGDASGESGVRPIGTATERALRRRVRRGDALELDPDTCWRLESGEVMVYRACRPIELWRAPCALDVTGTAQATFIAATDVELLGTERARVSDAALIASLVEENARLWRRVEADARRDDDTFLPDGMPVPGPWHFRDARALVLVVQGDPRRLRAALPRGVRLLPGTGGTYLLSLTRFEGVGSLDPRDTSRFAYHEVTPFVPAWSGLRGPAAFIPELYPDAWMAGILGREILGFPKRTARVGLHEAGGELIVDRRLALRVRHGAKRPVAPDAALARITREITGSRHLGAAVEHLLGRVGERALGFSALVHKRIGAAETAGRTLQIDDVVRVPILLDPVRRAFALEDLVVELPGGPGVLHGEARAGFVLETGFRFGEGRLERRRGSR